MRLTEEQIAQYDDQGFLVFRGLLAPPELDVIEGAMPDLLGREGPDVVREENETRAVRMVFGAHFHNDVIRRLSRHPRLVTPSEQIVRDRVHVYQSRLNAKSSFHGTGWAWHQDFNQWHRQDGMARPQTVVVGIYLDDVNPCNGPLLIIPGSHKRGHFYNPDAMDIDDAIIATLAAEEGIEPIMGPPGTVVFFDALSVHGSAANISPWPRRIFYLNYNAVSNRQILPLREPFHCSVDLTPISVLADDCLLQQEASA